MVETKVGHLDRLEPSWLSHRDKIAWIVLVMNLLISIYLWDLAKESIQKEAKARFSYRVASIVDAIEGRLATYEQVLRGGIGLFKASHEVSRGEWRVYVSNLQIEKKFPGIQGIGFSLKIAPDQVEEHVRKIQAEGFPDYKIRPEGKREEYTSIIYLEPFTERNRRAFGYDMFSNSVRREAMERARDTGEPTISGQVTLMQETTEDTQRGFLMYLPLYREGVPVDTPEQRRTALVGYVYSPFRMGNLMLGILGSSYSDVSFEIYDGDTDHPDSLLHDSDSVPGKKQADASPQTVPRFKEEVTINIYGHPWTVQFTSLPVFEQTLESGQPNFVLILGFVFSGLCFFIIHSAFTTRRNAIEMANKMSHDLKVSEERLGLALEGASDGIWDWNIKADEVYFSPQWMAMLGYEPKELKGNISTWEKLAHPEDIPKVMEELHAHLRGETPYYQTEHRMKAKNGDWVWILDRGKVVEREPDGTPIRAVGTHADITKQKITEGSLRLARAEAEKANKAKSEFLARMSHELRTPMNSILGFSQIMALEFEGKLSPGHKKNLSTIISAGEHLLELINDVLDLSKVESEKVELFIAPTDVVPIVQEVMEFSKPLLVRQRISMQFVNNLDASCFVNVDPRRFRQVVLNLVSNAIKYNRSEGTVMVSCNEIGEGVLRLGVRDTGMGIPKDKKDMLFKPFERLGIQSEQIEGTGIGLTISKKIVESMGGKLGFESEYGKGSFFYVDFPIAEKLLSSKPAEIKEKADNEVVKNTHKKKILYFEDIPMNVELVRQILRVQRPSIELLSASEAVAGIKMAIDHRPDLILMDIHMPGMDGLTALKEVQANIEIKKIPVIALTADAMTDNKNKGLEMGFYSYLTKPIDIPKFLGVIDEIFSKQTP